MSVLETLATPETTRGPRGTTDVHLSGIAHRVFPERTRPVFGMDVETATQLIESFGHHDELQSYLDSVGNGFIAMSEGLLGELPEPLPDLDAVLLAYHAPDLYWAEVAGCYLAQRLPGSPIPCSVSGPGPGAVFHALRIAAGMCRLGELNRGALFAYDQNAVVWESADEAHRRPDSAVLFELGATGEVAVTQLAEVSTGRPADPTPARALAETLERHPGVRVIVGAGLSAEAAGTNRVETVSELWSTGVWAAVARRWPIQEPVLLVDHSSVGGRLHSCLLVPGRG